MTKSTIRIFDLCRTGTHALGPGLRYAIWVQGCHRRCKGCITPESRLFEGGTEIDIDSLVSDIVNRDGIDGITISGGEPFLQAVELFSLLKKVLCQKPNLTVIIYTGFVIEELYKLPEASNLLALTDILIDGEYVEELNDNKGIRGSSNQRVIPLTNRLEDYLPMMIGGRRFVERVASCESTFTTIGIPIKIK